MIHRVLAVLIAMFSAVATCHAGGPYPVGLTDQTISVNGVLRQFRVHVPAGVTTPRALVLVLHGGGGLGLGVANTGEHPLAVFRMVADREGFVVVYPGGMPAANGDVGWNDCRGDNLNAGTADDVGFLAALVEQVGAQYALPTNRIFMAGGSNGGQMSFAFAYHRADLVAALATSSANLPENPKAGACSMGPSRPLPVLMTHSTADPQMPYAGGCVANIGGACNRGRVIPAPATRDRWLQFNGLTDVVSTQTVVDLDLTDGGPANRFRYAGNTPQEWWRLDGAGHTIASRSVLVAPNMTTGIQNRDIEFAEVAWAFFAERLDAGPLPIATPFPPEVSGSWYNVQTPGQGFNLDMVNPNRFLLYFYGYHNDGEQLWLYGDYNPGAATFAWNKPLALDMYVLDGGGFQNFTAPASRVWGTARITFENCRRAMIELTGESGSQVLQLDKLNTSLGLDCP
jgi:polyhydroxybutyrate depolymerase